MTSVRASIEEINYVAARSQGSAQLRLGLFEGSQPFEETPLGPGSLVAPVAEYDHAQGCSVTGGYVYRGAKVPAAKGRYFYGDYCSGIVWSVTVNGGKVIGAAAGVVRGRDLSSFGQDKAGELYLASHNGTVYRLDGLTSGSAAAASDLRRLTERRVGERVQRLVERA